MFSFGLVLFPTLPNSTVLISCLSLLYLLPLLDIYLLIVPRQDSKPHHAAERAVYADRHIVVPANPITRVQARVPSKLPDDRDYVFVGHHHQVAFYSHVVDANFAWVQAVNNTPNDMVVRRRERIGTLFEADMPMACAVESEAAELSKSPTAGDKSPPTEGLHAEDGIVPRETYTGSQRDPSLSSVIQAAANNNH